MIAINNAALTFGLWWADVLYAGDARWWRQYAAAAAGWFHGERWTIDPEVLGMPGMHQIEGVDLPGLSENTRRIHTGGNGGYQAIGLAVLWGARRIVLLGYDMQRTGGRIHCHADHTEALGNPGEGEFERWRQRMTVAAADLRRLGVEVVNCSAVSSLTCFERMTLEDSLRD